MGKTLNNYITVLDKTFLVCQVQLNGVSLCSFTTFIGAPVGIATASISVGFFQ